jgi:hypothetical protein
MATEKQVQSLAKGLALLIGRMDIDIKKREYDNSQEAANNALISEIAKKNNEKD